MTSFRAAIRIWEEPVRPISILEFLQRPVCATQMIYMIRLQRLQRLQRVQSLQRVQRLQSKQPSTFPDLFVL